MSLQECYSALGGSYEEVLSRLSSERLVKKFALKFLTDPSYDLLVRSMGSEDWPEAFRAAHTIKGVCANLGFDVLLASSEALTEALRDGRPPQPGEADLIARVEADYARTRQAIQAYQEGAGG